MKTDAGREAVRQKGWWRAHRWLLLRRLSQLTVLALFLAGPWLGYWIVKGNLNYSLTLGVLPLADPYVLLQSVLAGHRPERSVLIGALIIVVLYVAVGGRAYCAWVCPLNMVTDAAYWLRTRLKMRSGPRLSRATRYWLLAMTLVLALLSGVIAWELVNPVSMLHRGIIFGLGAAWTAVAAVFLVDVFVAEHAWCSRLCPVGAFYSALGLFSPLRVAALRREHCNKCADCYAVCPEPQAIKPALNGPGTRVIVSPNCINCGRCIDVCSRDVFAFGARFSNATRSRS